MEIWKAILDYEGLYEASNLGRIRSLKYGNVRILKPTKTKNGYLQVDLWANGKSKKFFIHRLVWEAFNGKIPEGLQVNHINEDKSDNRLCNLNLMTCKDNCNHGTRNKRIAETLSVPLYQIIPETGHIVREWSSIMECGRNGFAQSAVAECCNGKRKTHKGFMWVTVENFYKKCI